MYHSSKHLLVYGCICAAVIATSACSPHRIPPLTVEDLMEDRVALDGLLIKCNQNPAAVTNQADCENARIASERLASQDVDPGVERKRQEDFEKAREQLRLVQDKQRQEQEAKTKVDPYPLPVVPVEPTPPKTAPAPQAQTSGLSPLSGTSNSSTP
jgi:hypothetical protein